MEGDWETVTGPNARPNDSESNDPDKYHDTLSPPLVVVTFRLLPFLTNPYISAELALPNSHAFPASLTLNTLPAAIPVVLNCAVPTVPWLGVAIIKVSPNFNILIDSPVCGAALNVRVVPDTVKASVQCWRPPII